MLTFLLSVLPALQVHAGPEEKRLAGVYSNSGETLYCKDTFDASARFKIDYIYSEKQLLGEFKCITSRQCSRKPEFKAAYEDLHNMYPIERKVLLDRRGSQFDEDADDSLIPNECGYIISYLQFEPPDHAKGNIARALIYMADKHKLPLPTNIQVLQKWNKIDPPDEVEKARNMKIRAMQGNTNPFIDEPARVNSVSGLKGQ